jgi:hypothetical protein
MRAIVTMAAATGIILCLSTSPSIIRAAQPAGSDEGNSYFGQGDKLPVAPAMDLVGRFISERSGNDSGRIESLLIDDKTGKIEYFLIEGSPNFDLGGRIVAVHGR